MAEEFNTSSFTFSKSLQRAVRDVLLSEMIENLPDTVREDMLKDADKTEQGNTEEDSKSKSKSKRKFGLLSAESRAKLSESGKAQVEKDDAKTEADHSQAKVREPVEPSLLRGSKKELRRTGSATSGAVPSGDEAAVVPSHVQKTEKEVKKKIIKQFNLKLEELDRTEFYPIDYINKMFPNGQPTTADICNSITKMDYAIHRLEEMVGDGVRTQSKNAKQGKADLLNAQDSLKGLFTNIESIKSQAVNTEGMVAELCHDIKYLDRGKENISTVLTTLQNVQMMQNTLKGIKTTLLNREYEKTADNFRQMADLMSEFANYMHMEKIKKINDKYQALIQEAFEKSKLELEYYEVKHNVRPMIEICLVVDAIGEEKKKSFIDWFVSRQIEEYKKAFFFLRDSDQIERLEERYNWFKKYVSKYAETYGLVFPEEWNVLYAIADQFCAQTRSIFLQLFSTGNVVFVTLSNNPKQVLGLINALEKTKEFEDYLSELFEPKHSEDEIADDLHYHSLFHRRIGRSMDPAMVVYTSQEERSLSETLERIKTEESFTVDEKLSGTKVLQSSIELLLNVRNTVRRSLKLCSDETIADVFKLIMNIILRYVEVLERKTNTIELLSSDTIHLLCVIINTGEYLRDQMNQTETLFKMNISAQYQEQIDVNETLCKIKQNIIKKGLERLATLLCVGASSYLNQIGNEQTNAEQVKDHSLFVTHIMTDLDTNFHIAAEWIKTQTSYNVLCDMFLSMFSENFSSALKKCRRVNEITAERLLIDIATLKEALQKIAAYKMQAVEEETKQNSRFIKQVNNAFGHSEILLKVVLCPLESIVETFIALFTPPSVDVFEEILEIKTVNRSDKQKLIDTLCQQTNQKRSKPVLANMFSLK